jgi:hypothetical protein
MNCPRCQTPLTAGTSFCSSCGQSLTAPSRPGEAACAVHPDIAALKTCFRCGSFACAQCLVLLPGGVELCRRCEATGLKDFLPWDRRDELGTLRAWWQTCSLVLKSPTATFGQTPREGSLGSSLLFAAISHLAGIFTTALLYGVIFGVTMAFAARADGAGKGPFGEMGVAASLGIGVGVVVAYLAMFVVMSAVSLLFMAALDHLALKLVKAEPADWTVTVRAGALSMAPYVVGLIPLCGLYVFPIWSLVLKVFAYRAMHRTTSGKAAAGALLPFALLIALVMGLYVIVIIGVLAFAPKGATTN